MSARPIAELEDRRWRYEGKIGPNGRRLCRWCGEEVPKGRRTFCGDDHVDEWLLRSDPGFLRARVWLRDHGVCSVCGLDTEALRKQLHRLSYDAMYGQPMEHRWESARLFRERMVALREVDRLRRACAV